MSIQQITYGDLFKLFTDRNKDISNYISDYRPAVGDYTIQIWLKNEVTFYAKWVKELDRFVLGEINESNGYATRLNKGH